jgi:hypothetical protein
MENIFKTKKTLCEKKAKTSGRRRSNIRQNKDVIKRQRKNRVENKEKTRE